MSTPARHWPVQTMTNTLPATAGRIAGTAVRHLIWLERQIDWAEVGAIVLHGLQVLIVLTLLAGRATRRAWDALLELSERMGRCYSRLLVRPAASAPVAPPLVHPLQPLAIELEQLTRSELQRIAGCRRRLAKAQLVALALAG
jgi:hypothetical protein